MQLGINANLVAPQFYKTESLQTANYQNQYASTGNSLLQYLNYNEELNTLEISANINLNNNIILNQNGMIFNNCLIVSNEIWLILKTIYSKIPDSEKNSTETWQTLKYYNFYNTFMNSINLNDIL